MASLTAATNTSPMDAYRRREPPSTLMQRTSLAPELSATRSLLSCWIMFAPLLRPLEDVDDPPPLELRHGPGLRDADPVADAEVVVGIVGVERLGPLHGLGVARMADPFDDTNDGGLVHGDGQHQSLPDLAPVGAHLRARRRGCRRRHHDRRGRRGR